jgi:hypothetical protein
MVLMPNLRRWAALALLAALVAGPAGIAGILHPLDDLECAPFDESATSPSAPRLTASSLPASADDLHCPTCHLLRGMRWSVSVTPASGVVPQAEPAISYAGATPRADRGQPTTPSRAPPA